MAEIFLCHATERREAAEHLAGLLGGYGFDVAWDYAALARSAAGEDLGVALEREIRGAKAVLVMWCPHAAASHWLTEEAAYARYLGTAIPFLIAGAPPPAEADMPDPIDMVGWSGAADDPPFDALLGAVARRVGRAAAPFRSDLNRLERAWRWFGAPALPDFTLGEQMEGTRARAPLPIPPETPRASVVPLGRAGAVAPAPTVAPDPKPADPAPQGDATALSTQGPSSDAGPQAPAAAGADTPPSPTEQPPAEKPSAAPDPTPAATPSVESAPPAQPGPPDPPPPASEPPRPAPSPAAAERHGPAAPAARDPSPAPRPQPIAPAGLRGDREMQGPPTPQTVRAAVPPPPPPPPTPAPPQPRPEPPAADASDGDAPAPASPPENGVSAPPSPPVRRRPRASARFPDPAPVGRAAPPETVAEAASSSDDAPASAGRAHSETGPATPAAPGPAPERHSREGARRASKAAAAVARIKAAIDAAGDGAQARGPSAPGKPPKPTPPADDAPTPTSHSEPEPGRVSAPQGPIASGRPPEPTHEPPPKPAQPSSLGPAPKPDPAPEPAPDPEPASKPAAPRGLRGRLQSGPLAAAAASTLDPAPPAAPPPAEPVGPPPEPSPPPRGERSEEVAPPPPLDFGLRSDIGPPPPPREPDVAEAPPPPDEGLPEPPPPDRAPVGERFFRGPFRRRDDDGAQDADDLAARDRDTGYFDDFESSASASGPFGVVGVATAMFVALLVIGGGAVIWLTRQPSPDVARAPPAGVEATGPDALDLERPVLQIDPALAAWDAARDAGPAALRAFLEEYPFSADAQEARARLRLLDRDAWEAASVADSIEAYETYLAAFPIGAEPPGDRSIQADARIAVLRVLRGEAVGPDPAADPLEEGLAADLELDAPLEDPRVAEAEADAAAEWANVTVRDDPGALRRFLALYGDTSAGDEALVALSQLDEAAWAEAVRADDEAAYTAYLEAFPETATPPGRRVELAVSRLRSLTEPDPDTVREIERALSILGYFTGTADGEADPGVRAAASAYAVEVGQAQPDWSPEAGDALRDFAADARARAQQLLIDEARRRSGGEEAESEPAPAATFEDDLAARAAALSAGPAAAAAQAARAGAAVASRGFSECATCPRMIAVPPGAFQMGSPAGEAGRADDEGPRRQVSITASFALSAREVTWREWEACVAEGGCDAAGVEARGGDSGWGRGTRPVINVSWSDAQAYTSWLNTKVPGSPYRLASEAEWEYAARAGSDARFAHGDTEAALCSHANVADLDAQRLNPRWVAAACSDGHVRTAPVGSFAPNRFGLQDMHGNVGEWVADCYGGYGAAPTDGSAATTSGCGRRIYRGGGWRSGPADSRAATRAAFSPGFRASFVGIRVARDLPAG